MTVNPGAPDGPDPRPGSQLDGPPNSAGHSRHVATTSARDASAATCPYLMSTGGAWRQASPSRDHRCGAHDPPAPQTTDKQRRHCLTANHGECSIFRAARSARAVSLTPSGDPAVVAAIDAARRPIARTAPILLERPRLVDQAVRLSFDRGPGQLALVALMIVAFTIVALTRLSTGSPAVVAASASPSLVARASPSPTPRPTPSSSPAPSASAGPSPEPSFRLTYTVRKGDTLGTIANRFKVTTTAIRRLNHMTTSTIRIGQVLKIP